MAARAALKVVDQAEKEARSAADDAAREARAEALERVEQQKQAERAAEEKAEASKEALSGAQKSAAKNATKAAKADPWHRFTLDVWITNLNSIEFGFYKNSRNKAKSRQFTTDMDVIAEVIENGERTGVLGYREDIWRNKSGMDRRLVFKLFSDSLSWRATMDLMLGKSLQETVGARGLPVTCWSINTNDDDFIIYLERSSNKWPLMPENFSFFLIDTEGKPEFFRFKRDLIDIGGDFTLLDQKDNAIGHLDGKILTIGGKWYGEVKADHRSAKKLLTVMKLFCGVIMFNGQSRRHVKRLWQDVRAGRLEPKLEKQEADLYLNPRRVR
jgi:hypothetical protein